VDEAQGFVSLDAPQHSGDEMTTRKVALDAIASVVVTNVVWRADRCEASPPLTGKGAVRANLDGCFDISLGAIDSPR
jgi:hypothetical protein